MGAARIKRFQPFALAAALGLAGAAAFLLLRLPLPYLLGPIAASLLACLLGLKPAAPTKLLRVFRTVLGVAIGASFTPELAARLGEVAQSLALLPFYVLLIGGLGYPYFRWLCGFDHATAYYAAMPGGLQDMLLFGEEAGANLRALALVHATRVLAVLSALPFALTFIYGIDIANRSAAMAPVRDLPLEEALVMVVAALGGWRAASAVGLPGAAIVGPMLAASAASLTGLLHQRPPGEVMILAQLVIGVSVGAQYRGVTLAEIRNVVGFALGYCLILGGLAVGFEQVATYFNLAKPLDAVLAFAPGGQAEMTVLAIVIGADVAFVALHHVTRVFIVILGAPLAARLLRRAGWD